MIYFPFTEISVNLFSLFITGLLVGIAGGVFGTLSNLLIVPTLTVLGIPLPISASASAGLCFGRTSYSVLYETCKQTAFKRAGLVAGLAGLPFAYAGVRLNLFLSDTFWGSTVIHISYVVLLIAAAAAIFRQWFFFNRNSYYDDAPFPAFGLKWKFPLAIPGGSGLSRITPARVLLIGFILGTTTGLLGLGSGIIGIPLFMYILGLPERNSSATDTITMFILGSCTFLFYAAAGKVEFIVVAVLLLSITLGNHVGTLIPGELNLGHARLILSPLLSATAIALAISINTGTYPPRLILSIAGASSCLALVIMTLFPEKTIPPG
ncbi:MAG: TSUP family transporter [Bacillota bacterium]